MRTAMSDGNSSEPLCSECREGPATTSVRTFLVIPWLVIGGEPVRARLCEDCAAGKEFVAWAIYIAAAFCVVLIGLITF